jgi:hypothetical protein
MKSGNSPLSGPLLHFSCVQGYSRKKGYLMKKGESGLKCKDGTITVTPEGAYEGVDISIRDLLMYA